ncbi:hypothetical protein DAPPUDRAFT_323191 [Daphnia pulex]|uniref:RRM domain-containing protein n=1 Tax=Daphnia pulex TaxID=6669 RepID=E9GY56_DAPPU|nr:hypothetical protein DAPPUDRAFT_323191 [Daphnia pulex]|eukprot:EFX75621.1 hypothetical protein DAPPUDRAFT_323191 [Daphnia pulex]
MYAYKRNRITLVLLEAYTISVGTVFRRYFLACSNSYPEKTFNTSHFNALQHFNTSLSLIGHNPITNSSSCHSLQTLKRVGIGLNIEYFGGSNARAMTPGLIDIIRTISIIINIRARSFPSSEKFSVFGKVMEVGENPNAGLIRSVTITFYSRDAVLAALHHPEPILLNSVVLKITAWRPEEEADPPGAGGATCKPGITRQ